MSPLVYVVDDDPAVRGALTRMLKSAGLNAESFASAEEFREAPRREADACLILDLRLPGRSGIELQRELAAAGSDLPIVFLSAHSTARHRRAAIAAGAVAFLSKPVDDRVLLDAIEKGLARAAGTNGGGEQRRNP